MPQPAVKPKASHEPPVITRLCRPRRTRYRMLSILWIFPSSGAVVILALEARAGALRGWRDLSLSALSNVPVQAWAALFLLLLHALFLYLAYYYRAEPWHEVSFPEPQGAVAATDGDTIPRRDADEFEK